MKNNMCGVVYCNGQAVKQFKQLYILLITACNYQGKPYYNGDCTDKQNYKGFIVFLSVQLVSPLIFHKSKETASFAYKKRAALIRTHPLSVLLIKILIVNLHQLI